MSLPKKMPAGPTPYRPQQTPKCLQPKMAAKQSPPANGKGCAPVAPPIYRPPLVPKVLQAKMAQMKAVSSSPETRRAQPIAPPVYRPQPTPRVLQTKRAGAGKPASFAHSGKDSVPPLNKRSAPPATEQKTALNRAVAQRHTATTTSQRQQLLRPAPSLSLKLQADRLSVQAKSAIAPGQVRYNQTVNPALNQRSARQPTKVIQLAESSCPSISSCLGSVGNFFTSVWEAMTSCGSSQPQHHRLENVVDFYVPKEMRLSGAEVRAATAYTSPFDTEVSPDDAEVVAALDRWNIYATDHHLADHVHMINMVRNHRGKHTVAVVRNKINRAIEGIVLYSQIGTTNRIKLEDAVGNPETKGISRALLKQVAEFAVHTASGSEPEISLVAANENAHAVWSRLGFV